MASVVVLYLLPSIYCFSRSSLCFQDNATLSSLCSCRFKASHGSDFVMVHPYPLMQGIFSETSMCEDLSSVLHIVPERSLLCVWRQNAAAEGHAVIAPYLASLDLDLVSDLNDAPRDIFILFRGGCGHPDPSITDLFTAGKMLRYELVQAFNTFENEDIDAKCSCSICDNHIEHAMLQDKYRRARFCPVLASNAQSTRHLSEIIMAGCIPVFIGPPFHTLPLSMDIDYPGMSIFINITQQPWIDRTSSLHYRNDIVRNVWPLEITESEAQLTNLPSLSDVVPFLRALPTEVESAKRRIVLRERWKFYYGPKPVDAGGDGETSELAEILMKKMCRHASESKKQSMHAADDDAMDRSIKLSLEKGIHSVNT